MNGVEMQEINKLREQSLWERGELRYRQYKLIENLDDLEGNLENQNTPIDVAVELIDAVKEI